jgi:hypothetical protein
MTFDPTPFLIALFLLMLPLVKAALKRGEERRRNVEPYLGEIVYGKDDER